METFIPVAAITVNKQPLLPEHVDEFEELLLRGYRFPPVVVRALPDGTYRLVDGRHRLAAHKRIGRNVIRVRITL